MLGGGGGEGLMSFRLLGCLWKLLALWLRWRVEEDGKLEVLGREGLQEASWIDPALLPAGLARRGSLGVPMPGDDITLYLLNSAYHHK